MAPSRSGLLPKGTPGFGPEANKSTSGTVYMRPQWKADKPYHPGLRSKGTPGLATKVGLVVKPKSIMVQTRTRRNAVKPALSSHGLRSKGTPRLGTKVMVKPKSIMVQTRTRRNAGKPALSSHELRSKGTPGLGTKVMVKPKFIMVNTRTRRNVVKPAPSGHGLGTNRMPVCGVQPKSYLVQTRTLWKPAKLAPSGLGLGTNGTPRPTWGITDALKQRYGFVQPYSLPPASHLGTVQELWYVQAPKPITREKYRKPVPGNIMRIFISDPRQELVTMFKCSPSVWTQLNMNFKLISKKCRQKEDVYATGDPELFVSMVLWSFGEPKVLHSANVHNLLRAAMFFKSKILIHNCLSFIREHNLDLAKLHGRFLKRLAPHLTSMDIERLMYVKNCKGNTIQRLYFLLTFALMTEEDPHRGHFVNMALVFKCGLCMRLVPKELESCIPCVDLADMQMLSKQGLKCRRRSQHWADRTWSVESYTRQLLSQVKDWRYVYWLLWSETHYLNCVNCNLTLPVQRMFACPIHGQHEPRVTNLVEHAIYTTFWKNCALIMDLYQWKKENYWQLTMIKTQKRPTKTLRSKLTFSAPPLDCEHTPKYTGKIVKYRPKNAVSRYLTGRANTTAATLSDVRTPTRPNMPAVTHATMRAAERSNLRKTVRCEACLLLKHRLQYEAREQGHSLTVRPWTRRPQTKAKNCADLYASENPTASSAMRTCNQYQKFQVTEHPHLGEGENPTPSSEALPCPQRLNAKVSKDRNLGADEHRSRTPATQLPNTRVTNRHDLGAGENLTASSLVQPCNLSPRTRLTEHPTLDSGRTSSAQCLKTKATLSPHLSVGENPTSRSPMHPCTECPKRRSTKHFNLGSAKRLSRTVSQPAITMKRSNLRSGEHLRRRSVSENKLTILGLRNHHNRGLDKCSRRTQSKQRPTRSIKYASLGAGEYKPLSKDPIAMEMANPSSGASELLPASPSPQPSLCCFMNKEEEL